MINLFYHKNELLCKWYNNFFSYFKKGVFMKEQAKQKLGLNDSLELTRLKVLGYFMQRGIIK